MRAIFDWIYSIWVEGNRITHSSAGMLPLRSLLLRFLLNNGFTIPQ
jgi:hypothetical protein